MSRILIILKSAVESRKSAQALDLSSYMKKMLFTNKVTTHFFITLFKSISCTSLRRSTADFRIISLVVSVFLASSLMLSGCSGLLVAGAATGAVASQDRRTLPTQLEDENIELKSIKTLFENDELWKDTNISVVSFNNIVLLVGQAPTAELKNKVTVEIKKIAKVSKVHNQIRISAPTSFFASRNDDYITTKVKSSMFFTDDLPSSKVKVVTENSEVFLMGMVTQEEAERAVDVARNTGGVTKVIKVFEYIQNKQ